MANIFYKPALLSEVPRKNFTHIRDYGAVLDGSTDDAAALVLAYTDAITSGKPLLIDGDMHLASSVTVPATVLVIAQGTITVTSASPQVLFIAYRIIHEAEGWMSGFNNRYDIRAFGGAAAGESFDNTPAFDAAITYLTSVGGHNHLFFAPGVWHFLQKPADIQTSVRLEGASVSSTALYRSYVESGGDRVGFISFLGNAQNGSSVRDLAIYANGNSSGGTMLKFATESGVAAGFVDMQNIVISWSGPLEVTSPLGDNGEFVYGLLIDGSNNTGTPQGYRDVHFVGVNVFKSFTGTESVLVDNGLGLTGDLHCTGNVEFTGASASPLDPLTQAQSAFLHLTTIGEIKADYARFIYLVGTCNTINFTANSHNCEFTGHVEATITNAGTGGRVTAAGTLTGGTATITGTSLAILHRQSQTPRPEHFTITAMENPTDSVGLIWVDGITSSQFVVNVENDPGTSNLDIAWSCRSEFS